MRMLGTIGAEQFCAAPTAVGKREFLGSDRSVACDPRTSLGGFLAGVMVRFSAARRREIVGTLSSPSRLSALGLLYIVRHCFRVTRKQGRCDRSGQRLSQNTDMGVVMIGRIVLLVGIGFLTVVVVSLNGCCDHQCQANREKAGRIALVIEDDTDSGGALNVDDAADTGALLDASGPASFAKTTAGNGFVYPLDSMTAWKDTYDYAGYGACGTSYYTNTCHSGTDIGASRGSSVYAIGVGTVLAVSASQNSTCTSGWGYDYGGASTCNMGVAMQHYTAAGTPFVVVYGHLVYSSSVTVGKSYTPGDTIGVIANDYDRTSSSSSWKKTSSSHLHFGVFPGTSSPAVSSGLYGWGKLTCKGANQAASTSLPSSCTNNGSTAAGTYIGGTEASDGTGIGLELWWWLDDSADWTTISGEFTNEGGYGYGWNSNIAWSTWSDELYFAIADAGSGDSFRYSYTFSSDGVENWSCLGPFPAGALTGTPLASYNGAEVLVAKVDDPGSDGCTLQVDIP